MMHHAPTPYAVAAAAAAAAREKLQTLAVPAPGRRGFRQLAGMRPASPGRPRASSIDDENARGFAPRVDWATMAVGVSSDLQRDVERLPAAWQAGDRTDRTPRRERAATPARLGAASRGSEVRA